MPTPLLTSSRNCSAPSPAPSTARKTPSSLRSSLCSLAAICSSKTFPESAKPRSRRPSQNRFTAPSSASSSLRILLPQRRSRRQRLQSRVTRVRISLRPDFCQRRSRRRNQSHHSAHPIRSSRSHERSAGHRRRHVLLPLPKPFLVIATQNPVEHHGTYPLPESQLDRFLMRIKMGYPSHETEREILRNRVSRRSRGCPGNRRRRHRRPGNAGIRRARQGRSQPARLRTRNRQSHSQIRTSRSRRQPSRHPDAPARRASPRLPRWPRLSACPTISSSSPSPFSRIALSPARATLRCKENRRRPKTFSAKSSNSVPVPL